MASRAEGSSMDGPAAPRAAIQGHAGRARTLTRTPGGTMTTEAIRHSYSPDAAGTTSRAGAGYSENADSFAAGREAALEALRGAGGRADIVLAYTTSMHDPKLMLDGVRDAVGK